jgi:DNA-binding beta-propeller fold protein YncE
MCLGPASPCFDISWVDPKTQTYVLGDSSNSRLVIADAQQNSFVGEVTGFSGGPSGALIDDAGFAWAADGNSLAKVDLHTKAIAKTIDTGKGTDELHTIRRITSY